MSLVRCRMQLLVYLLWAEVPVSVGFSRTAVLFWSISSLCDPGWDLDSWIFSLLVCQVGRIRYKPYWLECETWGWSLTFPSCFPELLFMISLLPGSLGCFFFVFFLRSFRNLEFCLFCCSVTLSWLGLHSDPCAEVDRGKKPQGDTLPFWNHNSNRKILLSVVILVDFLSWWPPLPDCFWKPTGSLCSDLTTNVVTLSCFEALRKSIWTVYKLLLKGK